MKKKLWIIIIVDIILIALLGLFIYARYFSPRACHIETRRKCPEAVEECYRELEESMEVVKVCPEDGGKCYKQKFQTIGLACPMKSELFWCIPEEVEICEWFMFHSEKRIVKLKTEAEIKYEECLEEQEKCLELQRQWAGEACMYCPTPKERAKLENMLESETLENNPEPSVIDIQLIEEDNVKSCCSKYIAKGEKCDCGWEIVSDRQECECGIEPILNQDWSTRSAYDEMLESENREDEIAKGCIIYFDWCNTYYFENGDQTKKICFEYEESRCLEYKDNP